MNDTLKVAGRIEAELGAAKAELEKLRGLLREALDMLEEQTLHIDAPMLPAGEELLNRIRAALSQQAEPAPAQDERSCYVCHQCSAETPAPEPYKLYVVCQKCGASTAATAAQALARPAQTEQKPVAWQRWAGEYHEVANERLTDDQIARGWSERPLYAAPIAQTAPQSEFGDSYQGAREDLAIWKRRALEAEQKVRLQEQILDHLTQEAQGETRMGEPVIPQTAPQPEQSGLYTCIGKGGEYELIGRATTAGVLKVTGRFADEVIVYRDTESGELYCREPGDFRLRMARAALTAQGPKP